MERGCSGIGFVYKCVLSQLFFANKLRTFCFVFVFTVVVFVVAAQAGFRLVRIRRRVNKRMKTE